MVFMCRSGSSMEKLESIHDERLLKQMLDVAIHEFLDIAKYDEVYLVNDTYLCENYDQIYEYLLRRASKK